MPTKDQFKLTLRLERGGYTADAILSLENNSAERVEAVTVHHHKVSKKNEIHSRYDCTTRGIGPGEKVQVYRAVSTEDRLVFDRVILRFEDGSTLELDPPTGVAGGPCFVATALYRDPLHPDVVALRAFRDRALLPTASGRGFVSWYYRRGPALARALERNRGLRWICAVWLLPVLKLFTLFGRR